MTFSIDDQSFMSQALQLAERGRYTVRPNPRVGCVLVKEGELLSGAWHYRAGELHAEARALQLLLNPTSAQGATAYITLEPCSHYGKTAPCAQALIDAGVSRVVYAMEDPNPLVSGRGLALLREAGILVEGPLLEAQAMALNPGFVYRMRQRRPWVRCKLAASLDGRTAMANGDSQWITGPAARADVQRLRAQSCAVLTGIGSILQDNSRLSLRQDELLLDNAVDILALPPLRVVLDSQLAIDSKSAIFSVPGPVVIFTGSQACSDKEAQLLGFSTDSLPITIERQHVDKQGRLDLSAVLSRLAERYHCNEVLVEAGATLSGAFLQAQLIDELIIYQAPTLLGSAARPLMDLPLQALQDKISLQLIDQRAVGTDWRTTARILVTNE